MCALFQETYEQYDLSGARPAAATPSAAASSAAGFDTPALANRAAHFDVMHAHALSYLKLYYTDAHRAGE